jgi:WD40 repeat protein
MNEILEIFCCYAQKDLPFLLQLKVHLALLEREGLLRMRHGMDISPGIEREKEINTRLTTAQILLLLVSPDFIASDYCSSEYVRLIMERYELDEASIIPILLRPSAWQDTPFGKLQALPDNTKSIIEWQNRDKAYFAIAQRIEQIVRERHRKTYTRYNHSANVEKRNSSDNTHVQSDWGEAPDVPVCFGRTKELMLLEQWIINDRCRLVALVGMSGTGKTKLSLKLGRGGIGKTDLSLKLARGIEEQFDYIIWRRLLNAPKIAEILTDLIKFLSNQQEVHVPETVSGQISRLLSYLRKYRCLVILDNVEMILQGGKYFNQYYPGYEEYGQFFEQIAEVQHQSCLLLTSREKTPEVARLESKTGVVRSLEVKGLHYLDGKKIFAEIGDFSGSREDWKQLNYLYNGNPLALELAARHIKEVFSGNVAEFLREGKPIFADLRDMLDWHFDRLSISHKEVMYWFAINREPTSIAKLKEDILLNASKEQISSTLHSLQRIIPLEKGSNGFTLQPVLIEYMTQRFIECVVEEVGGEKIGIFNTHALLKTSVSDYVSNIQRRLILEPISERLLEIYKNRAKLEIRCREILSLLQRNFSQVAGYAGGNLLNLLCHLGVDLRGYDFSSLTIWQAYLQGVNLREVNFAYANLATSVFTDTFGSILSVAVSPHGDLLAAGTAMGEIRFWQASSGIPLQTLRGHTDWVWSVNFSPDCKTLISGSDDHTVRLWEVSSGQCLNTFHGHTGLVKSAVFSPDGRILASSSFDQTIYLWEVSNGQCLQILRGHVSEVRSVSFSPNGMILASGGDDKTVRLWEVGSGRCFHTIYGHSHRIFSVSFSSDGKILASGSDDQTVRLWKVENGQCLNILRGHASAIRSVDFSPDGKLLASGSDDQTIRLWEVSTGRCLNTLHDHANAVRSVDFSPDSKTLASGSFDQTVRLWEVGTGRCLNTLHGHSHWVSSVGFSPDSTIMASGSFDQTVCLWKVSNGRCLNTLQGHSHWVRSVDFSPDGKILASGSDDQTVRIWRVSNGQCLNTLHGHRNVVRSVGFSPDGSILVSGSSDQTVRLWEVSSGQCLSTFYGHIGAVRSVGFSSHGQIVASGSEDQTVRLWEVSSGQCLHILYGHNSWVRSVGFSPDGRVFASGGEDQTVRLWEVSSGRCIDVFRGHTGPVKSVDFSPDGKILASSSFDRTIRLWDIGNGQCLNILSSHSHWVFSAIFSFDGDTLTSGSYDGTIYVWDVPTALCLHTLRSERPYERMNITHVKGLTDIQKFTLRSLGAIEDM